MFGLDLPKSFLIVHKYEGPLRTTYALYTIQDFNKLRHCGILSITKDEPHKPNKAHLEMLVSSAIKGGKNP